MTNHTPHTPGRKPKPVPDNLLTIYNEMNATDTAKYYQVSRPTIRKWLKAKRENAAPALKLQELLEIRTRMGGDLTIDEAIGLLQEPTKELQDDYRCPDDKIKFTYISTYNLAPQIHSVSTEAQALLLMMIRLQAQKTGYVAVKKGFFISALHLGDKRGRRLNQYITELIDIGAINPVHIPPKGSKAPAIYQISDSISRIGNYTPSSLKSISNEIYSRTTECITVRTDSGEKQYVCGTLKEVLQG